MESSIYKRGLVAYLYYDRLNLYYEVQELFNNVINQVGSNDTDLIYKLFKLYRMEDDTNKNKLKDGFRKLAEGKNEELDDNFLNWIADKIEHVIINKRSYDFYKDFVEEGRQPQKKRKLEISSKESVLATKVLGKWQNYVQKRRALRDISDMRAM